MKILELRFPVTGRSLPIDHGYALYGAISRLIPAVHQLPHLAIDSIRGIPSGPGRLALSPPSTLNLRLPESYLPLIQPLAGQRLELDGHQISISQPLTCELVPSPSLHSRLVTVKGHTDPVAFSTALLRQLERLGIHAEPNIGPRRIIRISNHTIVGFEVTLIDLEENASLILQGFGLGGRRKMGGGFFNPVPALAK